MKKLLCSIFIIIACTASAWAITMTNEQAKSRIPQRELPKFWVGDVKGPAARWDTLQRGDVRTIGVSRRVNLLIRSASSYPRSTR